MSTTNDEPVDVLAKYELLQTRLYAEYQEAMRKITLLSLKMLAEAAREAYPSATVVLLGDSDQGDHLTITGLLDDKGDPLDDDEWYEEIDLPTAGNLAANCKLWWGDYISQDKRNGDYSLGVNQALTIDTGQF